MVILESIGKIEIYSTDFISDIEFFHHDDQAKFNASLLLLINIGEHFNKLSSEIKGRNSILPFMQVRGLRNRIAHDYVGIDYEMIFDIIKNEIPLVKLQLTKFIKLELSLGTFDLGELGCKAKHILLAHQF